MIVLKEIRIKGRGCRRAGGVILRVAEENHPLR